MPEIQIIIKKNNIYKIIELFQTIFADQTFTVELFLKDITPVFHTT